MSANTRSAEQVKVLTISCARSAPSADGQLGGDAGQVLCLSWSTALATRGQFAGNTQVRDCSVTMAGLDRDLAVSPCLTPGFLLQPGTRPTCASLPELAQRYKAIRTDADAKLTQAGNIAARTRADYDAKLKEVDRLTHSH